MAPADLLLRNVRRWPRSIAGPVTDVLIRDGRISAIGSSPAAPDGTPVADGAAGVLLPAFVDAHAHLDSTRLGLPFREHTAGPGLAGLVENDRRNWRSAEVGVAERATHTLGRTIAAGATLVRSHAQVDPDSGLERLEGVLAARQHHAGRARVEVVAFPQAGVMRAPGTADLLEQALLAGADLRRRDRPVLVRSRPGRAAGRGVRAGGTARRRDRHPSPRARRAGRFHCRVDL